jgi:hypothetical protein
MVVIRYLNIIILVAAASKFMQCDVLKDEASYIPGAFVEGGC